MTKIIALILAVASQVTLVNTKDLSEEMLLQRNGRIIVEQIQGVCLDNEGNGRIFDAGENNYINYSCVEGIEPGDKVTTYCIYNPDTNYTDDIIKRIDFIEPER